MYLGTMSPNHLIVAVMDIFGQIKYLFSPNSYTWEQEYLLNVSNVVK